MNPDTLLYLTLLMLLWIVPSLRSGFGPIWAGLFVLLQWLFSGLFAMPSSAASSVAGLSLLLVYLISSLCWEDPFSRSKISKLGLCVFSRMGWLVDLIGIRAQSRILAPPDNLYLRSLQRLLDQRNWSAAEQMLQNLGFAERYQLIEDFTDTADCDWHIVEWLRSEQAGLMSLFVSANHYSKTAWLRRGCGVSSTVTQNGLRDFYSLLELARGELNRAIELDDSYADPYIGLITIAMGTGEGRDQLYHYFSRAVQLSNGHYDVHLAMINALSEKWGGAPEEARSLATEVLHECKSNSPLAGMVAVAHIEHWLFLQLGDQPQLARCYFEHPDVVEELDQAYSVLDCSELESIDHIHALNAFAFCYYMGNHNTQAKQVFEQLKGKFLVYPWQYCSEPALSLLDPAFAIDLALHRLEQAPGLLRA